MKTAQAENILIQAKLNEYIKLINSNNFAMSEQEVERLEELEENLISVHGFTRDDLIKKATIKFVSVNEALPEYTENQARVYMKCNSGRITKGMFYYNGGKPVFAAYGSTVEDVTAWAYEN